MVISEVAKRLRIGEVIPYANADGKLTRRGSMTIQEIGRTIFTVRIQNGEHRRITQKDFDEVEDNLAALKRSGTHRQSMRGSRNVTYMLSILRYLKDK